MNHDIAIALSSSSRANTDFVLTGGIYMFTRTTTSLSRCLLLVLTLFWATALDGGI